MISATATGLQETEAAQIQHQSQAGEGFVENGPDVARYSDVRLKLDVYSHVGQQYQVDAIRSLPGFGEAGSGGLRLLPVGVVLAEELHLAAC